MGQEPPDETRDTVSRAKESNQDGENEKEGGWFRIGLILVRGERFAEEDGYWKKKSRSKVDTGAAVEYQSSEPCGGHATSRMRVIFSSGPFVSFSLCAVWLLTGKG